MSKSSEYVNPNWRGRYKNLVEFYKDNYSDRYYEFDEAEYLIDPMETKEQIDSYDVKKQRNEFIKCAKSFNYFCHKYVKIMHPKKGLLPFISYKYQRRVISEYDNHRFCIISKFRQGGLTTVTVLWAMWRCLFKLDEVLMVVSKTDREAIAAGEIVKRALEELPEWMQPDLSKNNDHQKIFQESGCKLYFYSPEAARGRSISYLIIDEAAFIPSMDKFWNGIMPTVATGGNVIVISTVNGVSGTGGWYYETYQGAKKPEDEGGNGFHIIDLDYWEHPEYSNEAWVKLVRNTLGEQGFAQEILRDFLGGGNSFIPSEILTELRGRVEKFEPTRVLFENHANKTKDVRKKVDPGALYIWREPIAGREYSVGVDASGGLGGENDNSSFEIIDNQTCEQVAEFYSNRCPPHIFSAIVAQIATYYNNALVIGEDDKWGRAIMNHLLNDLNYENMYRVPGANEKVWITPSKKTRPEIIELLQAKLLTRTVIVRSSRLVNELSNFINNKTQGRPEADRGSHDDAIMAFCYALYAREQSNRNLSVVGDAGSEVTERYKIEVYAEIKAELEKGAPEDWFKLDDDSNGLDVDWEDLQPGIAARYKRPHDAILKEFGW